MKQYRQALAETPACILDDDPESDSITIAVRLPRKAIADNHLFLAALSEAAAAGSIGDYLPAWRPRSLVGRAALRWLAITAWIATVAVAADGVTAVYGSAGQPTIAGSVIAAIPDHLKQGEPLNLEIVAMRNRMCPGTVKRKVYTPDGRLVWLFEEPVKGRARVGVYTAIASRIALPKLVPGEYVYSEVIVSDCGWFSHDKYSTPPAPFIVEQAS